MNYLKIMTVMAIDFNYFLTKKKNKIILDIISFN